MKISLTIIDDGKRRGVVAPSGQLSRKLLADMIDFLELSSRVSQKKTAARLQSKEWLPMRRVHTEAKKAR